MTPSLEFTDAQNAITDLSGVEIAPDENPYQVFINKCKRGAVSDLFVWILEVASMTGWEKGR